MQKYIADTNFILRYLLADNEEQYNKARVIFEEARVGKNQIEIEQSVFVEVVFVLVSFYKVPKLEIVNLLKSLFTYKGIKTNFDYYSNALDIYLEHNIHIVDALIAAKSMIQEVDLLTFDKQLQNIIANKSKSSKD